MGNPGKGVWEEPKGERAWDCVPLGKARKPRFLWHPSGQDVGPQCWASFLAFPHTDLRTGTLKKATPSLRLGLAVLWKSPNMGHEKKQPGSSGVGPSHFRGDQKDTNHFGGLQIRFETPNGRTSLKVDLRGRQGFSPHSGYPKSFFCRSIANPARKEPISGACRPGSFNRPAWVLARILFAASVTASPLWTLVPWKMIPERPKMAKAEVFRNEPTTHGSGSKYICHEKPGKRKHGLNLWSHGDT